jgi:hypothetical protein
VNSQEDGGHRVELVVIRVRRYGLPIEGLFQESLEERHSELVCCLIYDTICGLPIEGLQLGGREGGRGVMIG